MAGRDRLDSEGAGAVVIGDERLRVVFTWRHDRFAHAIEDCDGAWRTLLESIEGTAADDWPASPPLQQIHREDRPGGLQLVLAVGMAGRSHWSASVTFDPAARTVEFDIACRLWTAPTWLGSRYQVGARAPVIDVTQGAPRHNDTLWQVAPELTLDSRPHTARWCYRVRAPR